MADFGGMSADQINASMGFGPGGVGAQGQAQLNNNFGNFGQQTDYYSGLGAAYGRNVGEPSGMGSVFDQSAYGMPAAQPFQSYGLPTGGGGGAAPKVGGYDDSWIGGGGFGAPTNAAPSPQGLLGYTPSQPGAQLPNGFGYPGATPPSQMFNPNTYAPAQQQSSYGGSGLTPKVSGYDDSWMRGGGGYTPAGLSSAPRDMSALDFQLLGGMQRGQQNPDMQSNFSMPNFGNLQNPGQPLYNFPSLQVPEPTHQQLPGSNFGSPDYPRIPEDYPADTRGPGGRPSWMNPNPGGG
jgi:hypothetical protein